MKLFIFAAIVAVLATQCMAGEHGNLGVLLGAQQSAQAADPRLLILLQQAVNELKRINEDAERLLLALANRGHDNGFNPALAAIVAALASRRDDHDERPSIIKIPGNSYANSYGRGGYGRAFEN